MRKAILAVLFGVTAALPSWAGKLQRPPVTAPYTNRINLSCYIDTNGRQFYVGNTSPVAAGTPISYSGKIDNGEMTSGTVALPTAIPAHLYVILMTNPRFDPKVACQAWITRPPLAKATP